MNAAQTVKTVAAALALLVALAGNGANRPTVEAVYAARRPATVTAA